MVSGVGSNLREKIKCLLLRHLWGLGGLGGLRPVTEAYLQGVGMPLCHDVLVDNLMRALTCVLERNLLLALLHLLVRLDWLVLAWRGKWLAWKWLVEKWLV